MLRQFLQTTLMKRQYFPSFNSKPIIGLFFSNFSRKVSIWTKMSESEKFNTALAESEPQSAEVAFYKGKALEKLGEAEYGAAISAFQKASELDSTYKPFSEKHIGEIYRKLGKNQAAAETLGNAFTHLAEQTFKGIQPPSLMRQDLQKKQVRTRMSPFNLKGS